MGATNPAAIRVLQQLEAYSREPGCAQFRVGVRALPYLADHGFQGMLVLPGSFFIEVALCMEQALFERAPQVIRNVTFDHAVTLSTDDVVIRVEVREQGEDCVEYTFHEGEVDCRNARISIGQPAARLEVLHRLSLPRPATWDAHAIETFQQRSESVLGGEMFYAKLTENGNEYGRAFQNVSCIWRAGDETLGRLAAASRASAAHHLDPALLDSMVQLLAPIAMDRHRMLILRSIGRIELIDPDFPDTLWGHATTVSAGESEVLGNVRIFDRSGKPLLELADVGLALAERPGFEKPASRLVVAANFTAEPVAESLQFWADHLGARVDVEFAPYNQIFQQLLDPQSAFGRNRDGANVILLALDEWTAPDPRMPVLLDVERARPRLGSHARHTLPNGLEIAHLNRNETDYLYKEIFEDQVYLKHGVHLRDGDTIVDIGANIGLFSLFVMSRCANPTIYAFEPAPCVHELLKANCEAYGTNAAALNCGVSDRAGTAAFTFYENSSVFSGFHADESEDGAAIRGIVRDILNGHSVADDSVEQYVDELTADRLRCVTCECRLTSLSDFIRERRIEKIDLLKIDAEKCEHDIVRGIADEDWSKIAQIVIEVHDRTGASVERIRNLLVARGYRCAVEQEALLEHAGFFNLYATRKPAGEASGERAATPESVGARGSGGNLERSVRELVAALPSFMARSAVPLVLCFAPRTPAVQADPALMAALNDAETVLSREGVIHNVRVIPSGTPLQRYPVSDYYDAHAHHAGHVPYTPECYAAIGTELARTLFSPRANPYKVIALDCDNTLWKGICGEDGPLGVEVPAPYRALQAFMLERMNAGMLLCLVSKNNEQDAIEVFDRHPDMLLKREHLVSWRINWDSKSKNLQSLARELNLGVESFVFIDDNPVDCADARIHCPTVLTLQLPRNAADIPGFLRNIWAFDNAGATDEDRVRTRMYQESAQRARFCERSFSLKDFVEGLELRVEIAEAAEEQFARVSQLTLRTNQFNFTSRRRTEGEIREFLARAGARCVAVRVADRFGDYGVVGAVLYETAADRYQVDTLLLSCRALGRGVEHAIVSWLGKRAAAEGKEFVEFSFAASAKNRPALDFLGSLGDRVGNGDDNTWIFPAQRLAAVTYDPDERAVPEQQATGRVEAATRTSHSTPATDSADRVRRLQRIAEDLHDIEHLGKAIEAFRLGKEPAVPAVEAIGARPLETSLVGIWRSVLGRPRIGVHDNFFDAGGTSLKAVQVVARIKKELKHTLSIVSLFECPTVALLAARLDAGKTKHVAHTADAAATRRGQGRRYDTMRRYAS